MNKAIPVYIECYDHMSQLGWMDKDEFKELKPLVIYAVGFLTEETDEYYKLSGQMCSDGDWGDTFVILKSTVIKIKRLPISK
jgi:hypothetical protein